MSYFTRPEEALQYVHDLLDRERGNIGLEYVAFADETLIPKYPAAIVAPAQTTTEMVATRQFKRIFYVEILVMHAKLTVSRAIRKKEDLELTTRVVDVLHDHYTCGDLLTGVNQAVFSYVTSEVPQNIAANKNTPVIGTQLSWQAEVRVLF